jgi:hypothetical protein
LQRSVRLFGGIAIFLRNYVTFSTYLRSKVTLGSIEYRVYFDSTQDLRRERVFEGVLMEDYYDILGARPDDEGEKLKSAFREAIKATHPDIHSGDPNASVRFGRIVGAYSVLRDAEQRAAYDRQLERIRQRQAGTWAAGPVPQGAVRAAGKGGRRSSRAKPMHAIFGVKGPTVAIAIAVVGLGTALTGGSLWLRSTWKLPATVEATTSLPALIAVPAEAETSVRDQTAKVESVTVSDVPRTDSSLVGDFYFSPPPVVADVPSSKLANAPQVALPPAPRLFPRPVSSADRDEITGIIERARGLVAVGDIPTARVVLRRAYERGDERAALELGGTYDPLVLRRLNTVIKNSFADAIQARDWYVRAAELGSVDAIYRMSELDSQNR